MSDQKSVGTGLQGLIRMVADATIEITDLVETVHRRIVHPSFLPSTPIQHLISRIAGINYKIIRRSTQFISSGADKALGQVANELGEVEATEEREAIRSVLNGVVGDYLDKNENPLRISMQFRHQANAIPLDGKSLEKNFPTINGKVLLMVHGLCMNDVQWTRKEHNHGMALANDLGMTPLYLHYNSGRHISTNGRELNELLEKLMLQWPVPIEELVILAHSMGGLVIRSAMHYGKQQQKLWTRYIKKVVFLGTPHHGSPVERAGNYLQAVIDAIPRTQPFARLGKIRSAGVTDLRYGNIIDEDWQDHDRFEKHDDQRHRVPLPAQVECYSMAGTTGKVTGAIPAQWLGDNLVTVKSALGQHEDPTRDLHFEKENVWIAYNHTHWDLLSSPEVYMKIKAWLVS